MRQQPLPAEKGSMGCRCRSNSWRVCRRQEAALVEVNTLTQSRRDCAAVCLQAELAAGRRLV